MGAKNLSEVIGYDKAREILGEFSFYEFRLLRELQFHSGDEGNELMLVMETDFRTPRYLMKLSFKRVVCLRIGTEDGIAGFYDDSRQSYYLATISGFVIVNISDRQWEGLHWEVADFEDDEIHFYCKSVEIVSVTQVEGQDTDQSK